MPEQDHVPIRITDFPEAKNSAKCIRGVLFFFNERLPDPDRIRTTVGNACAVVNHFVVECDGVFFKSSNTLHADTVIIGHLVRNIDLHSVYAGDDIIAERVKKIGDGNNIWCERIFSNVHGIQVLSARYAIVRYVVRANELVAQFNRAINAFIALEACTNTIMTIASIKARQIFAFVTTADQQQTYEKQ